MFSPIKTLKLYLSPTIIPSENFQLTNYFSRRNLQLDKLSPTNQLEADETLELIFFRNDSRREWKFSSWTFGLNKSISYFFTLSKEQKVWPRKFATARIVLSKKFAIWNIFATEEVCSNLLLLRKWFLPEKSLSEKMFTTVITFSLSHFSLFVRCRFHSNRTTETKVRKDDHYAVSEIILQAKTSISSFQGEEIQKANRTFADTNLSAELTSWNVSDAKLNCDHLK